MDLLKPFRRPLSEADTRVLEQASAALQQNEFLSESVADLQLMLEDVGWQRLGANAQQEFTTEGRRRAAELCAIMRTANPLMKRGFAVRNGYIWGQGCSITARSTGDAKTGSNTQDVNAVVQATLDDPSNVRAFSGVAARTATEAALFDEGERFRAHFTSPLAGRVQIRHLPAGEIVQIVNNPDDRTEPWFYIHEWTRAAVRLDGTEQVTRGRTAYPAMDYRPINRPRNLDGVEIRWDAPVLHIAVNQLTENGRGVGDGYAALPWARSYKGFLENWATIAQSLSRFAWRKKTTAGKAQAERARLAANPGVDPVTGAPLQAGATALHGDGAPLEAIPKSGATIDADSGRPLASMVASALDVPVTVLTANPGPEGSRAVAETLDKPTEDVFALRQALHAEADRATFMYVIREAVRAPQGPLKGSIVLDKKTRSETVVFGDDTETTVDITFPPLSKTPVDVLMKALADADATGLLDSIPVAVARRILEVLGFDDIDELLDDMLDEHGEFIRPELTAGQAAVDAFNRGDDAAEALRR